MSNDPIHRCEPPPEHEDQMWHWLKRGEGQEPVMWFAGREEWYLHHVLIEPDEMFAHGWRYVCVCPEPEMESETIYITMKGET